MEKRGAHMKEMLIIYFKLYNIGIKLYNIEQDIEEFVG